MRLSCTLGLLALLGSFGAFTAHAGTVVGTVYEFTGTCTDCAGFGTATLVLGESYIPGQAVSLSDLITFNYHGTNLFPSYQLTAPDVLTISGTLPVTSGPADFQISGELPFACDGEFALCLTSGIPFFFSSSANGNWETGGGAVGDFGTNGNFVNASVPEPASFVLMGGGLAGLALLRRRKQ